jgi:hypothetical protein
LVINAAIVVVVAAEVVNIPLIMFFLKAKQLL